MFTRSSSGDKDGSGTPSDSTGEEASQALDQVVSGLRPSGAAGVEPGADAVAAGAEKHADLLRAAREARRDAQAMLTLAAQSREDASEEAERIVLEARDASERARIEIAGWAAEQRAKVDALVAEIVGSAQEDAVKTRAEALRAAMTEADERAELYVAEAARAADQDAQEIRNEARRVLDQATALGREVGEAIIALTATAAGIAEQLDGARDAMERLLAENPPELMPQPDDEPVESPDVEEPTPTDVERMGAAATDLESVESSGPSDSVGPDEDFEDLEDVEPDGSDDADDSAEPGEPAEPATPATSSRTAAARSTEQDRQLGSMFRRQGQHGQRGGR